MLFTLTENVANFAYEINAIDHRLSWIIESFQVR